MRVEINNSKLYLSIDTLGAELKRLYDLHGVDYVWQGDEKYWSFSSPILFPIIGALRDNKYVYGGKTYEMPKHGIARRAEFKKVSGRTDAVTFLFESDEKTKKVYPFDFSLYVSYELIDFSLSVKYKIVNNGKTEMPFSIGAHPAFRIPIENDEKLTDYRIKFGNTETADCTYLTKDGLVDCNKRKPILKNSNGFMLDYDLFKDDALIFDSLTSRSCEVYSLESGRGVRVDFDGFDYFGIWQPYKDGVPFLCLEPWSSTATITDEDDTLEHKRGMTLLSGGDYAEFQYKITVI